MEEQLSRVFEVGTKVEYQGQAATITYWDANRSCQQRWTHITKSGGPITAHEDCQNYEIELATGGFRRVWTCQLHTAPTAPVEPRTPDSPDFPTVGHRMTWTAPDKRTTVTVQRLDFTYTVTTAQGTYRLNDMCGTYPTEKAARADALMWAELIRARTAQPEPAPVTPISSVGRPVARGHQIDMSRPQAEAIAYVMRTPNQHGELGILGRGNREGCLTDPQLRALRKRGYVELTYQPNGYQVSGARVTPTGERRANEILTTTTSVAA